MEEKVRAQRRDSRTFWLAAGGIVVLCLLYLWAAGSSLSEPVYVSVALVLTGGFAVVARRRRLEPGAAWMTFAVGLLLMTMGDGVYGLPSIDIGDTGLTWADLLYLVGSAVMVLGAIRLKGSAVGERDRESMIDACSIGLAIAVLAWQPLIEPRLNATDVTPLGRLASGSYPLFDVVVVAMMCWILLGSRARSTATSLLLAGSVAYLVADLGYTIRIDQGTIDDPSLAWLDIFWLAAYGLYVLAVLHPSARRLVAPTYDDQRTISRSRLALSGMTLIAPIIALGVSGADARHVGIALTVECVLVVLVLVRLSDLAAGEKRARQNLADQELLFRSVVQNASEAVAMIDGDLVVTYASPAVRDLLRISPDALEGHGLLDSLPGLDRSTVEAMVGRVLLRPGAVVTGEVALVDQLGAVWLELRLTNLLHEPAVRAIVANLHDVSARHLVQQELERRASTDPLTGLLNRLTFLDRLGVALAATSPEVAVIYCDLDGFKGINDRYGHDEGDRVLDLAAARLAGAVREGDLVARLGGDEFAVMIHGPGVRDRAGSVAARMVQALRTPLVVGGVEVHVSASVGLAAVVGERVSSTELVRSADQAMYRAKRAGGDRVVLAVTDTAEADDVGGLESSAAGSSR